MSKEAKMSDMAVIVGSIIHILMFNMDKDPVAKIPRKSIMRAIKKQLAITRSVDSKYFKDLVYMSVDIMNEAKDNMIFNGQLLPPLVTPDALLQFLKFRYTAIFNELNVSVNDIKRYRMEVKDVKLTIPSIVFINRIIEASTKRLYRA